MNIVTVITYHPSGDFDVDSEVVGVYDGNSIRKGVNLAVDHLSTNTKKIRLVKMTGIDVYDNEHYVEEAFDESLSGTWSEFDYYGPTVTFTRTRTIP